MVDRISPTFTFERVSADLTRINRELQTLQDQLSSGRRADDVQGLGVDAAFVVSTRSIQSNLRASLERSVGLETRLAIQDAALDQSRVALEQLADAVLTARTNNDPSFLASSLETTLRVFAAGLNTTSAGQFVFGGEEIDRPPVLVTEVEALVSGAPFFRDPVRPQFANLEGAPFEIAPHAATIAGEAFEIFRDLRELIGPGGSAISQPLTAEQEDALLTLAGRLNEATDEFARVQGRNGDLLRTTREAVVRLEGRDVLLSGLLGDRVDADPTEIALSLSERQSQFEALSRVIASLRDTTLLNFLP